VARHPLVVVDPSRQRGRVGLGLDGDAEHVLEQPLARDALVGFAQSHPQGPGADRRLELAAGASAMTLPWSMTTMRSSARTICHNWVRLRGSRPVVGSSRKIRSGVTTMLAAISIRRRIPPELV
jgi:hypothetical protein